MRRTSNIHLRQLPLTQTEVGFYLSRCENTNQIYHSDNSSAKRLFDIILAICTLVAVAPLLALVALIIRLESPGPILFSQLRFGRGKQLFRLWKFRTMKVVSADASGAQRTLAWDPRVTRVGRFLRRTSIDELPQLFNVLAGHMSLVGPRPHTPHMRVGETYFFEAVSNYHMRHVIRPGLTGWAQVNGSRGEVDTLEKACRRVELDLWYVDNRSALLDLKIMVRTVLGGFLSLRAD